VGGRNFFRTICELDHIHPYESGVICGYRVGASRFQYPGRARPHGRHIPPAALFFAVWLSKRADISQAGDLRFTGIAGLNAPPNQPEEIHS
jgi:hypothetical protein